MRCIIQPVFLGIFSSISFKALHEEEEEKFF